MPRVSATRASAERSPAEKLREVLAEKEGGAIPCPCCHDGLSAKLIERAGFRAAFVSGFTTSASRLGMPDAQLMTYSEMLDSARSMREAAPSLPLIVDADNGGGDAMNVRRAVRGYASAGLAGILLEDQRVPKSCGHELRTKEVVSRAEALAKIKMAVDTRDSMPASQRIAVVARTDAKRAVALEEAIWRVEAFADLGADAVFVDALESEWEMRAVAEAARRAGGVPVMANLLEGGVSPTDFTLEELDGLGFKLVAYPLSLLGASINAMEGALASLKAGEVPAGLPSFAHVKEVVGFPEHLDALEDINAQGARLQEQREAQAERERRRKEEAATEAEAEAPSSGGAIVLAEVVSSGDEEDFGGGGMAGPLRLRVTNAVTGEKQIELELPANVGRDIKDLLEFLRTFGLDVGDQGEQRFPPPYFILPGTSDISSSSLQPRLTATEETGSTSSTRRARAERSRFGSTTIEGPVIFEIKSI